MNQNKAPAWGAKWGGLRMTRLTSSGRVERFNRVYRFKEGRFQSGEPEHRFPCQDVCGSHAS